MESRLNNLQNKAYFISVGIPVFAVVGFYVLQSLHYQMFFNDGYFLIGVGLVSLWFYFSFFKPLTENSNFAKTQIENLEEGLFDVMSASHDTRVEKTEMTFQSFSATCQQMQANLENAADLT